MTRHELHHFERGIVAWHVAIHHGCASESVATASAISGRRRGTKAWRAFMLGYLRARRIGATTLIPTAAAALAA